MKLKNKQKQALDILKQGHNVFLSGEAGTGKSFVIERFKEYLDSNGVKYVVAAPTGLAALNIGGVTLHRIFGLSIELLDFNASMKNVEEAEVIIIDEISMCRKDVFQKIAKAIKDFENPINEFSLEKEVKVCRKKQIVVVGDFFQLPPVLTKDDEIIIKEHPEYQIQLSKDDLYAFQCKEWELFDFKNIVLKEVVRQSDKDYIDNLNKLRRGNSAGLDFIEKKSKKSKTRNAIYLCGTNKEANRINESNLSKMDGDEYEIWSEESGEVKTEDRITQRCLKLKKGARVMSLINEKEDIANGMLGTVIGFGKDDLGKKTVTVKFDNGKVHEFKKYKWEIKGFKKLKVRNKEGREEEKNILTEIGEFKQIPLKLAWAITIHKSQGQSYETVNLNPHCFCEGQLYVGLSRAKDLKKLYLTSELKSSYLKTSEVVKEFYKKIENEERFTTEMVCTSDEKMEIDKEEYITMKIPKTLENQVLNLIKRNEDSNTNDKDIEVLQKQIQDLKAELEQVKASSKRRPKVDKSIELEIIELRKTGMGMNKISKQVGCGDGTVRRVLKDNNVT